jgi:hypothetical protein
MLETFDTKGKLRETLFLSEWYSLTNLYNGCTTYTLEDSFGDTKRKFKNTEELENFLSNFTGFIYTDKPHSPNVAFIFKLFAYKRWRPYTYVRDI